MKDQHRLRTIIILSLLASLVAFSIDIYLPSLPSMASYFNTTREMVSISLVIFIFGYAVSQLIYGPCSDRFGRKPVLIFSLSLYCVMTVFCLSTKTIYLFDLARFLQAFGACGSVVVSFAIARDLFQSKKGVNIYAFLMIAISVSPLFAPVLGGYLTLWFNWQSNFIFLLIIGLALLITTHLFLPETNRYIGKETLCFKQVARTYYEIINNKTFLFYALQNAFAFSILFAFLTTSSFLLIDILGVPIQSYGYYFMITATALLLGSSVASQLTRQYSFDTIIAIGISITILASLTMIVFALLHQVSVWTLILPMAIADFGAALVMPSAMSGTLLPFPDHAGSASALGGFIRFCIAAVIGLIAVDLLSESSLVLGCTLLFSSCMGLSLFVLLPKLVKKRLTDQI